MKSLSILFLFLSLILISYACSDKSNEVNTELPKPPLPNQLGYSSAQIKYWLKDEIPTKDNDTSLVYRYYEADYEYEDIIYFLDSNKVTRILKSYFYTDMDYQKYSSEKRFSNWITELRREQFTDEGSKVVEDKKNHMDGIMARMFSRDKKIVAVLLFNWNDWTKEAITIVQFSRNNQ